jgi:hypothetical protein
MDYWSFRLADNQCGRWDSNPQGDIRLLVSIASMFADFITPAQKSGLAGAVGKQKIPARPIFFLDVVGVWGIICI